MLVLYGDSIAHPPSFHGSERGQQDEQMLVVPQSHEQVKGDRDYAHLYQQGVCVCPCGPSIRELAFNLTPPNLLNKGIEHAQVWMVVPGKMPIVWEQLAFQDGHEDEGETTCTYNIGKGNDRKFALIAGAVQPRRVNQDGHEEQEDFFCEKSETKREGSQHEVGQATFAYEDQVKREQQPEGADII